MLVAVLTILIGAVLTAAGIQELVVQGIFNNKVIPLTGGTLGAVAGALLLSAGIALVRQSTRATDLIRAAAIASVPVFVIIGQIVWGLAGWPVTIIGLGWPLFLLSRFRNSSPRVSSRQG